VTKSRITKQDPPVGMKANHRSSVSFVVRSGPSPVVVPDLVRKSALQASRTLTKQGPTLDNQNVAPSDKRLEGLIIDQTPKAGMKVKCGSSVSITVSSGQSG
jgi:eukaryotic-like serine/threonine-protein kinase